MTDREPRERRLVVALASSSFALACAVLYLATRQRVTVHPAALRDPRVQRLAVERLVSDSASIFDSHPDPAVSRVLLPNLRNVPFHGAPVTSNVYGMRERHYEVPKPADVLRVVLLGDSFVFGLGVHARDRLGVFLRRALEERSRPDAGRRIEVLHIAIGSWNTIAECAYLLRNLSGLDPDLVVQVFITNDLDDNAGARGFGSRADFDPLFPERGDCRVSGIFPLLEWGAERSNPIMDGVDWESRKRFDLAADWLGRLVDALRRRGCPYLFLCAAGGVQGKVALRHFGAAVPDEARVFADFEFLQDPAYRIAPDDGHWTPAGHARVAQLLYGTIRERGLLPALGLEPWAAAEEAVEAIHRGARRRLEAERGWPQPAIPAAWEGPYQIYGGVSPEHLAGPYASLVLAPSGAEVLEVRGGFLERPELAGARVQIFVEELELAELTVEPGASFERRLRVPPEIASRPYANVRFVSDGWVLTGHGARDCVSFRLDALRFVADTR